MLTAGGVRCDHCYKPISDEAHDHGPAISEGDYDFCDEECHEDWTNEGELFE